jgi:hypothetical protein
MGESCEEGGPSLLTRFPWNEKLEEDTQSSLIFIFQNITLQFEEK